MNKPIPMMQMPVDEDAVDYYMSLPYTYIVTPSVEGGYVARVAELSGCITEADTWEELLLMIKDAQQLWIESAVAHHDPVPVPEKHAPYETAQTVSAFTSA